MSNEAVELHDSIIIEVKQNNETEILALLSPAIVHVSSGDPGVDSGEIWHQNVGMVFCFPFRINRVVSSPCNIIDATLIAQECRWHNVLPIDLFIKGAVTLNCALDDDSSPLVLSSGSGFYLRKYGNGTFVEYFP